MATNIPPHNLERNRRGDIALIDNPDIDVSARFGRSSRARISRPAATSTAARASRIIRRQAAARIVMRARAVIEEKESVEQVADRRHRAAVPGEQGEAR